MVGGADLLQVVSIAGAVLILVAYGAGQVGWMHVEQPTYSLLNLVGSVALAYVAIVSLQYGFILMEGAWVLISLASLIRRLRPHPEPATLQH
jgi:hypothetical protein